MSKSELEPKVFVAGQQVAADRVQIVETPRNQVVLRVDLPALELRAAPDPAAALRIELGSQQQVDGIIVAARRIRSSGRTSWRLRARTSLLKARTPWIQFLLEKSRADLLRLALEGVDAAGEDEAASDEQHPVFVALGGSRWRHASHLALLGGQLLLATTDGFVLARPDNSNAQASTAKDVEEWSAGARIVPELVLMAMSAAEPGQVLRHVRAGMQGGGTRRFLLPHASFPSELRAAAAAVAANVARGDFRMEGGPGLDSAPGTWIQVDGSGPRLVTERRRTWSRELGWRISLAGRYPWKRVLRGSVPSCEPAEVLGFEADKGLARLKLTRLGLDVIAGLRADRASANHFSATLPNTGDRGLVEFAGCAEEIVYMGAPLPEGVLSPEEIQQDIDVLRDEHVSSELTRAGMRRHEVKEETWTGNHYEFKKSPPPA